MLALQRRPTPPQKIKSLFGTVLTARHIDIVSLSISTRSSSAHLYGARGTDPQDKLSSPSPEYAWKTQKRRLGREKAPAPLPACQQHRMDLYHARKLQRGLRWQAARSCWMGPARILAGWGWDGGCWLLATGPQSQTRSGHRSGRGARSLVKGRPQDGEIFELGGFPAPAPSKLASVTCLV